MKRIGLAGVMCMLIILSVSVGLSAKTTLSIWVMGEESRYIEPFAREFEAKNADISVKLGLFPYDIGHNKLVAGLAGATLPDISAIGDHWLGEFYRLGGLQPLNDLVEAEGWKDGVNFLPDSWEHGRWIDGNIYSAPFFWDVRTMFWRKDLFEEVGLQSPPETWQELLWFGRKLTQDKDGDGVADQIALANLKIWLDFHMFSSFLYSNGGRTMDATGEKCLLTEPEALETLHFYNTLYDLNILPKREIDRVEGFRGFRNGFYTMLVGAPLWLGMLKNQAPDLEEKWTVSPFPKNRTEMSYGHPNVWIVMERSENKEAAYRWIKYWETPEVGKKWFEATGEPPCLLETWEDPLFQDNPKIMAMREQGMRGTTSLHTADKAETIIEITWNMLTEVKDDVKSPEEAAQDAKRQIERLIE